MPTGIDLSSIAKTVELYMQDTVLIERSTESTTDPVSLATNKVWVEIYNGPGFVAPMGDPAATALGGKDVYRIQYEVGIPRTSPEIKPNDRVSVTSSEDPVLQGAAGIFVHDEIPTTFFSHRRVKAFRDVAAT